MSVVNWAGCVNTYETNLQRQPCCRRNLISEHAFERLCCLASGGGQTDTNGEGVLSHGGGSTMALKKSKWLSTSILWSLLSDCGCDVVGSLTYCCLNFLPQWIVSQLVHQISPSPSSFILGVGVGTRNSIPAKVKQKLTSSHFSKVLASFPHSIYFTCLITFAVPLPIPKSGTLQGVWFSKMSVPCPETQ